MIRRPRYTTAAVSDLAQIWEHHAERVSIRLADELVQRIEKTIREILTVHPLSGRLRPELGDGVRSCPAPPYVIFYRVEQRYVQVLRVLHGHRDVQPPLASLLMAV